MKNIYIMHHKRIVEYDKNGNKINDKKFIGAFSSREKALEVQEHHKQLVGFKDCPDGFTIEEVELDFDDFDFELSEE